MKAEEVRAAWEALDDIEDVDEWDKKFQHFMQDVVADGLYAEFEELIGEEDDMSLDRHMMVSDYFAALMDSGQCDRARKAIELMTSDFDRLDLRVSYAAAVVGEVPHVRADVRDAAIPDGDRAFLFIRMFRRFGYCEGDLRSARGIIERLPSKDKLRLLRLVACVTADERDLESICLATEAHRHESDEPEAAERELLDMLGAWPNRDAAYRAALLIKDPRLGAAAVDVARKPATGEMPTLN